MPSLRFAISCACALLVACTRAPAPPAASPPAATTSASAAATSTAAAAQPTALPAAVPAATTQPDNGIDYTVHTHKPDALGFTELDWLALMPQDEIESLKKAAGTITHVGSKRMKQSGSYRVMGDVLGQKIKLPGYVVPIESDDKGRMTEFFFVPFFGACIHVPPPPPNQVVHVHLVKPIKTPEIWDAFMLKGELRDEKIINRMAGSAYSMQDAALEPING